MLITTLSDACRRHASSSSTPTQPTNTDSNKPILELIAESNSNYPRARMLREFIFQTEIHYFSFFFFLLGKSLTNDVTKERGRGKIFLRVFSIRRGANVLSRGVPSDDSGVRQI
ncbi:hypothetical protein PUN28_010657 [Cardiocondyla obscurior]|uniref:Uncharacterized protein n=1 Tax=Cardiocondyla obscurior TaxID=286306 RepID=A0AAW2FLE7_9HYME